MLPPPTAIERTRPSLARDLWTLAALHAGGLAGGIAALNSLLGAGAACRWAAAAAAALAVQWVIVLRQLARSRRAGEDRSLTGLGRANWISLLRGLLLSGAAGFGLLSRPQGALAWAPMGLFTAAISLDMLDGYLARRAGQVTRLGEALELGLDSLAMLVGSGLAVRYGILPWWYLSFGLASPAFRAGLAIRARLALPARALPASAARRRIAGFSMGFLSAALWPIVSPIAAARVGLLFLIPFLTSFGRDWAAVSGRLDPEASLYRKPLAWLGRALAAWGLRAHHRLAHLPRPRLKHLPWLAGPALLWLVLRDIPLAAMGAALRQLTVLEILALALVNLVVVVSFSGRWWSVLRALGRRLPYFRLVGYRLAGFAVSYFTPGPHFGGEPLQAYLLHRGEGVPAAQAAASVLLEKTIEMLINFGMLALGVLAIARLRLVPPAAAGWLAMAALALLALPVGVLAAAWAGARPASAILGRLPARWTAGPKRHAAIRAVGDAEQQMTEFCRRRPAGALGAIAFSLVSWAFLLGEYWLALRFLGLEAGALETLAVVGAARLAILLPFPGALGALEASQVLALSTLGYTPAQGAALALLIRARDLAFGAAGLVLGLRLARSPGDPGRPAGVSRG